MTESSAVIVGAGPAGISVAVTLAECGLQTTVVDENPLAGGQVFRQPPAGFQRAASAVSDSASRRGDELRRRFANLGDRIEFLGNRKVWGLFDSRRLAVANAAGWRMIQAERLVLAPGAYEFVPPFPGWTTPGVMTPGAAQLLAKSMHVLPGKRVLVAGTGPFLLVVANCLHDAGVRVVGVVECTTRSEALKAIPGLLSNLALASQGWRYLRRLRRAGIPIHTGHVILDAQGQEQVERVRFAPCDADWRPDRSRAVTVEVDTLCVGYGFIPRSELAQLAGCDMRWADELGGWIPATSEDGETSVNAVYVAGDGGGVAGALVAEYQGTLVGLHIARQAGAIDEATLQARRREVVRRLKKLRRFRRTLDKLSRVRPGLTELATDDTVVCRCEELTRSEVDIGVDAGCATYRSLKVATRLGMGPCQGRMCWPAMARRVALRTGRSMEQVGLISVRPPIVPMSVGELAEPESAETIRSGGSAT
jgi:NADPH-dependent 2,4-dienoyl-CoA reductase/sulfur reductase-like enzyme